MASTFNVSEIKNKMERELLELKKCSSQHDDEEFCDKLSSKYASAYNKLCLEILHAPMLPKNPINPFVASAIGNSIGGVALGITAGVSALEKKKVYDKVLAEFTATQRGLDGALEELRHWHSLVCEYINSHPYVDYEKQKRIAETNSISKSNIEKLEKERVQQEAIVQQNAKEFFGEGFKAKRDAKKRLKAIEKEIAKWDSMIMPED